MALIIFHGNCPDGFGSAWLLQQSYSNAELHAGRYGEDLPDIDGKDVYLVDFCYPTAQLEEIYKRSSSCTILDHHQTAEGYLAASSFSVYDSVRDFGEQYQGENHVAILDQNHSGVGIVMQYTDRQVPFLYNIEDRDLWKFLLPETPAVFAAVTSRPYTIDAWNYLESMHIDDLVIEGQAILRYRDQMIEACVKNARLELLPTGHRVWVTGCPYAIGSDVAGELAKRLPDLFGAYYVDEPEVIRFGLRSTEGGLDVAKIAEQLGGGGHKHASGFEVNRQWRGWS